MRALLVLFTVAACTKAADPAPAVTLRTPASTAATASASTASSSGTLLPPPSPGTLAWRWDGEAPGFGKSFYHAPRTVRDGSLVCSFVYTEKPYAARTACERDGRELWHQDDAHAFVEDAALVLDHGVLYSARISNISSGCILHAFDAATGAERWATHLQGLGPVAHSEYLNAVQLRLIGGYPVVFGWESYGRYIEALDPANGATARHVRL